MKISLKYICGAALIAPLLALGACQKDGASANTTDKPVTGVAADNTAVNARDRGSSVTPMDQGNNPADLETTQNIRKALMADDSLSVDAKNAKVITANGVITLRGPVKSDAEKQALETKATQLAGSNHVENHLDVVATK